MQDQKGNIYSDILKNFSAFLALALPIIQFLQTLSQVSFVSFLGDQSVIFTTSLLALLVSVFVLLLFRVNPYFRLAIPFQESKNAKWQEYLRKTDPNLYTPEQINKVKRVSPPTEITSSTLIWVSIPVFLLSGFSFMWMGLNFQNISDSRIIILQAVLYATTIVTAVYVLSALTSRLSEQDRWNASQVDRIKKAINLAKENDGFGNFPKINFIQARTQFEQGASYLIIEVLVGESKYRIITDSNARVLHAVNMVEE